MAQPRTIDKLSYPPPGPSPQKRIFDSRLGTGPVHGTSVLMEEVRGQPEHHNKQNNDKEENRGWFAILLLQLLEPYVVCRQTIPKKMVLPACRLNHKLLLVI